MKTSSDTVNTPQSNSNHRKQEGAVLGIMVVVMLGVISLTLILFMTAQHSGREAIYAEKSAQAFWLAEAAIEQCRSSDDGGEVALSYSAAISDGRYEVIVDPADPTARIATASVSYNGERVTRRIRFYPDFNLFDTPFYVGNGRDNDDEYTLHLLGEQDGTTMGPPTPVRNQNIYGGNDVIEGDPEVNGNVFMQDDSAIIPDSNGEFSGNLYRSGSLVMQDSAYISGSEYSWQGSAAPNLASMGYTTNNTYDVAQIFNDAGIVSGRLPDTHPLASVLHVVKNPSDRSDECAVTPGDDFFFEQSNVTDFTGANSVDTATSPLNLGEDVTYYVDGEVWFHSSQTYGFEIDGQAIIVSTYDIHISDNLAYKDASSDGDMLALVAMGSLDSVTGELAWNAADGDYVGGDIFFGDPDYGTLYTCDAFMFANDDFMYNTTASSGEQAEPESGFKVFGSFMAIDRVVLQRDWFTTAEYDDGVTSRNVYKDNETGNWYFSDTGEQLGTDLVSDLENEQSRAALYSEGEWIDKELYESTGARVVVGEDYIRHYAMVAGYDNRITEAGNYISLLPQGSSTFSHRIRNWTEID